MHSSRRLLPPTLYRTGGLCPGGLCPGGLCQGISVQGVTVWGSLSRGVSVKGVSVQGSLCPGEGISVRETPDRDPPQRNRGPETEIPPKERGTRQPDRKRHHTETPAACEQND